MGNRVCGTTTTAAPPTTVAREAFAVTVGDVCTTDAVTHLIRVNVERTAGTGPYGGWVSVENHPPLSFTSADGGPYVSPAFRVNGNLTSVAVSWDINGQFGRIDAVQISGCVPRAIPSSSTPETTAETTAPAAVVTPSSSTPEISEAFVAPAVECADTVPMCGNPRATVCAPVIGAGAWQSCHLRPETVAAPAAAPASSGEVETAAGALPVTGGASVPLVLGGAGLVVVGGGLMVATRRRAVA